MKRLRARRTFAVTLLIIVSLAYLWLDHGLKTSFQPAAQISGTLLFCLLLGLAFFNARKKLPFLPLLKASTWMQIHIYVGYFAMLLCAIHAGFKIPTGGLDITVATLFAAVSLSGIFGLIISRSLPSRLTVHGETLTFERIPGLRKNLRSEVENMVVDSVESTGSSTIADFYEKQLSQFFGRPLHCGAHLLGSKKPLHQLIEKIDGLNRYLNEDERKIMAEITERVRSKDNLDFQWYGQGILKLWLFVHIPLTFGLLIFAAMHGLLAWKFT